MKSLVALFILVSMTVSPAFAQIDPDWGGKVIFGRPGYTEQIVFDY